MVVSGTDQTAEPETSGRTSSTGRWVYLPEDVARQHPLYGVFGWAMILLACLCALPPAILFQDVRLLLTGTRIPSTFWAVFAVDVVLLVAAWAAAARLAREQASFLGHFLLAAALALLSGVLFLYTLTAGLPAEYEDRGTVGFVVRSLSAVLWTAYVLFSRRISVTVRKRVHVDDPFLRAQWMADRPLGLRPNGTRGTIYARPFRAVPLEHPPQDDEVQPVVETAPAAPADAPAQSGIQAAEAQIAAPQATEAQATPSTRPVWPPATTTTTVRPPGPSYPLPVTHGTRPAVPPPPRLTGLNGGSEEGLSQHRRWENSLVLDRLRRLQIARDEGLISDTELQAKRADILKEL